MPVDDHPVHPSTKKGADWRYGCWNRGEFKGFYTMLVGEYQNYNGNEGYVLVEKEVENRMSRDCKTAATGWAATDPWCQGCGRVIFPKVAT